MPSNFSIVPESWFSVPALPLDEDIAVPDEESLLPDEDAPEGSLLLPVDAAAPDLSLLPVEADAPGSVWLLEPDVEPLLDDDEVPLSMLPELLDVVPDGLAVLWSLGAVAELPWVLLWWSSPLAVDELLGVVQAARARTPAPRRAPNTGLFIHSPCGRARTGRTAGARGLWLH